MPEVIEYYCDQCNRAITNPACIIQRKPRHGVVSLPHHDACNGLVRPNDPELDGRESEWLVDHYHRLLDYNQYGQFTAEIRHIGRLLEGRGVSPY